MESRLRVGIGWVVVAALVAGAASASLALVAASRGWLPGVVTGGPAYAYTQVVERGEPAAAGEPVVKAVARAGPAVVNIHTLVTVTEGDPFGFFAPPRELEVPRGRGSGFIVNGARGYVVTNLHVVEGAERIRVSLPDRRAYFAKLIGFDSANDIALLQIPGNARLPQLAFADSDRVLVGQTAIAIGNPYGFENSVTTGVVSALGRELEREDDVPLVDVIQTSAPINPGNSGGPLVDLNGRVIGMTTAIDARGQGLGFADASNTITRAIEEIVRLGYARQPYLGVELVEITPDLAQELGLPSADGVAIRAVAPGSPAEAAGLQPRDVITGVEDQPVVRAADLRRLLRRHRVNDRIVLRGFRDGRERTWTATLQAHPRLRQP